MSNHWQKEKPEGVGDIEQGRMLSPQYDYALNFFPVTTAEWQHVCPCRFGEARGVGEHSAGWTGDSYRYDIYRRGDQWAFRWWNGSGEGWMLASQSCTGETALISHISGIQEEARRWDFIHAIWQTAHKTELAAAQGERGRMFKAFCEGRLKKRRRGGKYIMQIEAET